MSENATAIISKSGTQGLTPSVPADTDPANQGASHIREIKQVLVNMFPQFSTGVAATPAALDAAATFVAALSGHTATQVGAAAAMTASITATPTQINQGIALAVALTATAAQINAVAALFTSGNLLTLPSGIGSGNGGKIVLMSSGFNSIELWNQNGTLELLQVNPSTGAVLTLAALSPTGLVINGNISAGGTVHGTNV